VEILEARRALTGNIAITGASVVDQNDKPLTAVTAGQWVYIESDFTTQDLPSSASYRVAYTVNGLTLHTGYLTWGAGSSGTGYWVAYWGTFLATPGTNQVIVVVDPDKSVAETTYADNTMSFTFNAAPAAAGTFMSYTVAQIRAAYGLNSIPKFGSAAADGSGQTIALDEAGNDPNIIADLDSFDRAMSLTTNSTETLYQQYGAASSFANVFNQGGTNITANIATSGSNGVPAEDPTGHWEGEETLDVEWAHAMAPGAKIDIIEVTDDSNWPTNLLTGDALAARLPDVSAVSNSWGLTEWSGQTAYDSSTFVTPSGHTGVTFLTASNDNGANVYGSYGPSQGNDGYYPATSPNVLSVGGTELTIDNNAYGSETGWSYPAPTTTIDNASSSYTQSGPWASQSGGFSGTYSTAAGGSSSSAVWTIAVTPSNTGWGTEVSATWTASPGNATNATYTIYDGSQASGTILGTVVVDQTKPPLGTVDGSSQFQELGVFFPTLASDGTGTLTVVLDAKSANGAVVADTVGAAPAWASTGGPTRFEAEPSYQLPFQSTGHRTTPDVSFDASENSGADTYYTPFNNPSAAGLGYGAFGTSLSSPCWAGLIAVANQGLVAEGLTTLNSRANPQQTLQVLYKLPASDFYDITTGYNGFSAGPGYDEVTGRGSPIANLLIPDLVSAVPLSLSESSVSAGASSVPAGGTATVILTAKEANGVAEAFGGLNVVFSVAAGSTGSGTFSNVTDNGNGTYSATFTAVSAGKLSIAATIDGQGVTSTAPTLTVVNAPLIVSAADWTSAGLTLTIGSDGNIHVYVTGTTTDVVPPIAPTSVTSIDITAPTNTTANLTIDSTNGDPIPPGGLVYSGGGGLIKIGSGSVNLSDANTYTGGTSVSLGTLVVSSSTTLPGGTSLTVGAGGTLILDPSMAGSNVTAAVANRGAWGVGRESWVVGRGSWVVVAQVANLPRMSLYTQVGNLRHTQADVALSQQVSRQAVDAVCPPPTIHCPLFSLQPVDRQAVDAVIARQYAGDLAWLAAGVSSPWSGNQSQKKDPSLQALDALLAEYGSDREA